jgi:hypothetical protein
MGKKIGMIVVFGLLLTVAAMTAMALTPVTTSIPANRSISPAQPVHHRIFHVAAFGWNDSANANPSRSGKRTEEGPAFLLILGTAFMFVGGILRRRNAPVPQVLARSTVVANL